MRNLSEQAKRNQYEAQRRIHKATLDRIVICVKKGERDKYKEYARTHNVSLNKLFINAVNDIIKKGDDTYKTD